ncbi:MAG: hypothetical protein JJT90_07920 [Ectothiorhodospiraceae bacterium]|nr:hypothetical protein [Ectothiorhodospiraceae bacterium]
MRKGRSLHGHASLPRAIRVSLGCLVAVMLAACNSGDSSSAGGDDHADDTDPVVAQFDYAVEEIAPLGILGFRLYADAQRICMIDDPYRHTFRQSDCDMDAINALEPPVRITVTAFREGDAAAESAHSNAVLIDR